MKVIVTGCEYTGASTLARGFVDWLYDEYGGRGEFPPPFSVHDHFEIPDLIHEELKRRRARQHGRPGAAADGGVPALQRPASHADAAVRQPAVGRHHGHGRLPPGRGDIRADVLRLRPRGRAAGPPAIRQADRRRGNGVRPGHDHGGADRQAGRHQAAHVRGPAPLRRRQGGGTWRPCWPGSTRSTRPRRSSESSGSTPRI